MTFWTKQERTDIRKSSIFSLVFYSMILHIVRKARIFITIASAAKGRVFSNMLFLFIKQNNFLHFPEVGKYNPQVVFSLAYCNSARHNIEVKCNGSTTISSQWSFEESLCERKGMRLSIFWYILKCLFSV